MPKKFDVAIVGASLAGSSAATLLARAGMHVALVDKNEFPRRKPCGEGLSPLGIKQLGLLGIKDQVLALPHLSYCGYRIHAGYRLSTVQSPWGDGLTIQRSYFDDALLKTALSAGVEAFIPGRVLEIKDGMLILPDEQISARVIVVACGANSKLIQSLGGKEIRTGPRRIGITTTFKGRFASTPEHIQILIKKGYEIYCTPLADGRLNVSLLTSADESLNIRKVLESKSLVSEVFDVCSYSGEQELPPEGRAPIGNVRRTCSNPYIYLVGDAKEEFDPIGGMGMSHALRSGILAAEAIIRSFSYDSATYRSVANIIAQAERSASSMRAFTKICYYTFRASERYPMVLCAASTSLASGLLRAITKGLI